MNKVTSVHRMHATKIAYAIDGAPNGSIGCHPAFADFIMNAWTKRDACGFTVAQTPKGQECVIYVVPTTDGMSLMFSPKRPLHIIHTEKDASKESMVQITLEDE